MSASPPLPRRPRAHVAGVLVGMAALAALTVAAVPMTTVRAQRHGCATAIALRDKVPLEQMLGTQLFTRPLLAAGYDAHEYIEATDDDDGRRALRDALLRARGAACTVDLFFLAHGDRFVEWVAAVPDDERPRLRLVYDTGAGDAAQGPRWVELGARAFVGHPGANLAPVFYAFFLPAWIAGAPVDEAVTASNAKTFVTIDSARPYLGAQTGPLWRGTRAVVFGDGTTARGH